MRILVNTATITKISVKTCLACSSDSRTKIPAPSPITKPSLAWSNGLEASSGVSLYTVDKALKYIMVFTIKELSKKNYNDV